MSQFLYFFRDFFMSLFVCFIAHMRPNYIFLTLFTDFQFEPEEIRILSFEINYFGFVRADFQPQPVL